MRSLIFIAGFLLSGLVACAAGMPPPQGGRETAWTNQVAALAPSWRAFEAKCAAKSATREDLIVIKRQIAASAMDGLAKTNWTQRARKVYQESKKRK